jgi:hypothetical protein
MKIVLLLAFLLMLQDARPVGGITGQIRAIDGSPADHVEVAATEIEQYGNVNPATAILVSVGQTDAQGRYRLEKVPPGRYFITAGFADSPSYFPGVKTRQEARSIAVTANQVVSGIDFTLATSVGVHLRGRVLNLPTTFSTDLLTIRLQPTNSKGYRNQPVPRDGRFEFSRVVPGQYNLRVLPGNTPPVRIDVNNKDVDGVVITAGTFARGRASVDDGSALPFLELAPTAGVVDSSITVGGIGRAEGRFILPVSSASSPADYKITPIRLPLGYYLKSITPGSEDLLRSEIELVLTKTPPEGTPKGVRISGRVTRLENAFPGATVYLSLESSRTMTNPTAIVGETTANRNRTFEFRNVPPGRYVLRAATPQSSNITLDVTNRDIVNLELPLLEPRRPAPVAPPPETPQAGRLFFTQTGVAPRYEEGAITFFRIDRGTTRVEEVRMDAVSFVTLQPGAYFLRSYLRPCNGECRRLDAPKGECSGTFSIIRGQVLNAERVMQGETCTIRFKTATPK